MINLCCDDVCVFVKLCRVYNVQFMKLHFVWFVVALRYNDFVKSACVVCVSLLL